MAHAHVQKLELTFAAHRQQRRQRHPVQQPADAAPWEGPAAWHALGRAAASRGCLSTWRRPPPRQLPSPPPVACAAPSAHCTELFALIQRQQGPVHLATTSATSAAVTSSRSMRCRICIPNDIVGFRVMQRQLLFPPPAACAVPAAYRHRRHSLPRFRAIRAETAKTRHNSPMHLESSYEQQEDVHISHLHAEVSRQPFIAYLFFGSSNMPRKDRNGVEHTILHQLLADMKTGSQWSHFQVETPSSKLHFIKGSSSIFSTKIFNLGDVEQRCNFVKGTHKVHPAYANKLTVNSRMSRT